MLTKSLSLSAAVALATASAATALTVTITDDADALAAAALAASPGVSIVAGSASLIGGPTQQGTYSGFNLSPGTTGTGSNLALNDGVVLTSGLGTFSTTENTDNSADASTGTGSFQPLVDLAADGGLNTNQNDSNVLSFDFTLDDPTQNAVKASFEFATDEFPTQFVTDIMGIFVNGVNYAFFPNGDLVSNQSGDPNSFFNLNPVGTGLATGYGLEWNGLTDVFDLTMLANGGGAVNTIDIAIADTSDTIYDSALFFTSLMATTTTGGGGIIPTNPVVPLPASAWMLLAGVGGLGAMRRLRKS